MAAMPTGMLIQKIDRQPSEETSTPPTTGPEGHGHPHHRRPDPDRLGPLAGLDERVGDDGHGHRVEHRPPTPWSIRNATRAPRLGARLHSSEPAANTDQADHEGALAPEPVGHRARQHEQAGQHQRVGVDRPLQPGHRGVVVPADRREGDIDDGHVESDDQQAHRADQQDADAAAPARLGRSRRRTPAPDLLVVT